MQKSACHMHKAQLVADRAIVQCKQACQLHKANDCVPVLDSIRIVNMCCLASGDKH